jgi:L-ribulose-5-phosphate 3-epimerase
MPPPSRVLQGVANDSTSPYRGFMNDTGYSHSRELSRRAFLRGAATLPVAVSTTLTACARSESDGTAQGSAPAQPAEETGASLFGISLAEWSLHRTLNAGQLSNLEFPRVAREDFGIEAVEYVNTFFKDRAEDRGYLTDLKSRCDDLGVRSLLIMCDGEGDLGDPDDRARTRAIENHHRWIEAARFLGCHSIRVNARSAGSADEQRRLAADGLRRLTEFAAEREINVIVENHGGISSDGAWLASVMEQVDHPRCGTLPDFGNFQVSNGEWYDRYRGVSELMPYAKAVSAKSHEFDAQGNETGTDYFRMMRIVLEAGYRGFVGIEYEGAEMPETEGIHATKALLERVRDALAEEFA